MNCDRIRRNLESFARETEIVWIFWGLGGLNKKRVVGCWIDEYFFGEFVSLWVIYYGYLKRK